MMAEHIITESAINGSWKKTVFYMLDMEECGPLLEDFKSLYIFFIEFCFRIFKCSKVKENIFIKTTVSKICDKL